MRWATRWRGCTRSTPTSFSLDRVVLPELRALVQATGESAAYHVRQGQGSDAVRLCLYRVDSPHPVRDHIRAGDVLPMNRGTGGRVLSAFDPALAKSGSAADRKLLAAIRERGYFAATGDRLAEVAGISAPVLACRRQPRRRRDADHAQPPLPGTLRQAGAGSRAPAQRQAV